MFKHNYLFKKIIFFLKNSTQLFVCLAHVYNIKYMFAHKNHNRLFPDFRITYYKN